MRRPINPIPSFYASVSRKTLNKTPAGGYEPGEKMSRDLALRTYTINGAFAAFEENIKGSIEVGKLADITAISLEAMNTMPINNPLSQVVYSVNSTQVTHVWIGGRMVLRDRCLETMDMNGIRDKAKHWQHRFEQG